LENLLVNAFRHGERDSAVRIQVDARRLSISNRGRISSAVLERLGEPFNTSDTGAGAQGQGLGLAWVATLARSLGWIFQIRQEGERVVCEMCFEWFRFEGNS
jgi:signal transduction histidine kinase